MQKFHPSPRRHYVYGMGLFLLAAVLVYFASTASIIPFIPSLLALFIFLAAYAAAATFRAKLTTYSLDGNSLVMERAFLTSEKQIIPVKNIDNLRITESPLGRILGVSDVYVDTPGGEGYELLMRDVPQSLAQQLAEEVQQVKGGG